MFLELQRVLWTVSKLLLAALGFLYAGVVLTAYRSVGSRLQLRVDRQRPLHPAQQLLVWLGVKALAAIVRLGSNAWEMLSDTSADFGEWCIRRRGGQLETLFRSRFL
jgi:hypothetical protein